MSLLDLGLVNGNAEGGSGTPSPGWTTESGPGITRKNVDNLADPRSGGYMLSPSGTGDFTSYQDVDVSSHAAAIDAGTFVVEYRGYQVNGFSEDTGRLIMQFFDGSPGSQVGSDQASTNQEILPTGSWKFITSGIVVVPALTRTIRCKLEGTVVGGSIANTSFDDLELIGRDMPAGVEATAVGMLAVQGTGTAIGVSAAQVGMMAIINTNIADRVDETYVDLTDTTNLDAESGTPGSPALGWTNRSGPNLTSVNGGTVQPRGNYRFEPDGDGDSVNDQDIDLTVDYTETVIDAEALTIVLSGLIGVTVSDGSTGKFTAEFYDDGMSLISSVTTDFMGPVAVNHWMRAATEPTVIPSGTRTVRIVAEGKVGGGARSFITFDDLKVETQDDGSGGGGGGYFPGVDKDLIGHRFGKPVIPPGRVIGGFGRFIPSRVSE